MKKKEYDIFRKNQANLRMLLRGLVSLYLCFLAYRLVLSGGDDLPLAVRITAGILFAVCAAAFGVYAFRRYRTECREAELTEEELAALEQSEDDER